MKTKKALMALDALAQESRLAVFRLLLTEDKGEGIQAGVIAEKLGVPATTMSFHLSQLKASGLIESHKIGKAVMYSANRKKAKKLAQYITGKDILEARESEEKYQALEEDIT